MAKDRTFKGGLQLNLWRMGVELRMKEIRIDEGIHVINQLLSPLFGSGPPCCGGGLSGFCLLIIHFKF